MILLQCENELDEIKNDINESNKIYKLVREENNEMQPEIPVPLNNAELNIYEKEVKKSTKCVE